MGDAFISAKLNLLSSRHDLIYPVELDACLVYGCTHACDYVAHILVSLNASFTRPTLHSLHSMSSGGVSVSGGALCLFSLDVCMCQQGGEV